MEATEDPSLLFGSESASTEMLAESSPPSSASADRRKTVDPAVFADLFGPADAEDEQDENNPDARRATIRPSDVSGLFRFSVGSQNRLSAAKSQGQTPRITQPQTPPTPPQLKSDVKVTKSILKSSNKPRQSAPRSVSFQRKRSVLSFDYTLPVTSLTPAGRKANQVPQSAQSSLVRPVKNEELRNIDEGDEEYMDGHSKLATSSQKGVDDSTNDTQRDSSKKPTIQDDTFGDATMTIPNMSDFMEENEERGQSSRRRSRVALDDENNSNSMDRRATLAIPSILDFADSTTTNLGRRRETLAVPNMSQFLTADEEANGRDSPAQNEQESDADATLQAPSVSNFIENGDDGDQTMDIPSISSFARDSVAGDHTMAVPSLLSFTSDSPAGRRNSSTPNSNRRQTLDVPSLLEFLDANSKGRETMDIPSLTDFVHDDAPETEEIESYQIKKSEKNGASTMLKKRGWTFEDAINHFFPGALDAAKERNSSKRVKWTPGAPLIDDLTTVNAESIANALIGVHKEGCLSFCEEQLSEIVESRSTVLPPEALKLPLPAAIEQETLSQLAERARMEALIELNEWLGAVHGRYLQGLHQQVARLDEDNTEAQKVLDKLEQEKQALTDEVNKFNEREAMAAKAKQMNEELVQLKGQLQSLLLTRADLESKEVQQQKELESLKLSVRDLENVSESSIDAARIQVERTMVKLNLQQSLCLWTLDTASPEHALVGFGTFRLRIRIQKDAMDQKMTRAKVSLEGSCASELAKNYILSYAEKPITLQDVARMLSVTEDLLAKRYLESSN